MILAGFSGRPITVPKTKIPLLRRLKFVCFICSVTRGPGGANIVTEELFFGSRFLDYVDSLFFFLPFSSKSQAETARASTATTHEDWSALREHLQQDHRQIGGRDILIRAWKNWVATSFEQPPAASSSSIVDAEPSIFDLADDDDAQVPAPPPPVQT